MPAPRPIVTSFENPTLLGRLATASGDAVAYQRDLDRWEARYARDLQFLNSEMDRRQRAAEMDARFGESMLRLSQQDALTRAAMGDQGGVTTFDRYGRVPEGGRPVPAGATRLQDAQSALEARQGRSASAARRAASPLSRAVRDPFAPDESYSAVRGPQGVSFSASGEILSSPDVQQAQEDYRLMSQLSGQPMDPKMLKAMSQMEGEPPRGGYVGPGSRGVPEQVAQQLQVLAPYSQSMLPEDFQALEAAIRSGQMPDMDRLINQLEDAMGRKQRMDQPDEMDPRFRTMSVREHQQEIAMLQRHRAEMAARDVYGEYDLTQIDRVIEQHRQAIGQIRSSSTSRGETGTGGPRGGDGSMVVVTNGRETFRIPVSDLGAAQAEGFREAR